MLQVPLVFQVALMVFPWIGEGGTATVHDTGRPAKVSFW
jgi:hypothetical protein